MKILIAQPKLEQSVEQLKLELESNPSVDIAIFPEGYVNQNIEAARDLAKQYDSIIITGHKNPKDRALIINRKGEVILDRAKYDKSVIVTETELRIGHILCDELVLQGLIDIEDIRIDFVAHPIGVGMFSDEQFEEWIDEAKKLAKSYKTMIIGTSHADGSFRGSDISIPIAYCIGANGEEVFISKNDTRTRIMETDSKRVEIIEI